VASALEILPLTDLFIDEILQRFEHSTGYHKKISTYVSFPEELDMTPFMSSSKTNINGSVHISTKGLSCKNK
jgi:ubiquitin carboxyl-terminal hydrolase 22/27/51